MCSARSRHAPLICFSSFSCPSPSPSPSAVPLRRAEPERGEERQANHMVGRRHLQPDIGHEINAMGKTEGDLSASVHASRASQREHSRGSSRDHSREHSRERGSKHSSREHSRERSSRDHSREHSRERGSKHGSREYSRGSTKEHSRERSSEHANRDRIDDWRWHAAEARKHLQESKRRMSYREFRRTQSGDSEASRSVLLPRLRLSLSASRFSPLLHEHCQPARLS
jgi:hypothetical protein